MADYEREKIETIDKKVGDTFKIKGYDVSYFEGNLHLPENAFVLRRKRKKSMSQDMGAARVTGFTIEALLPGTYEIEYQHYNPMDPANRTTAGLTKICSADVYIINVSFE